MTWKDKLLIIFAVIILLLTGACIGIYKYFINPVMVYEWKGKTTETIYVNVPGMGTDECYKSPIWIDGKQNGKDFLVTAGDDCKHASRLLTVKTSIYHHVPMLSYTALYNIEAKQFRHGINGMYFYNFGPVALGGGMFAVFDKTQLYDIGPTIGLAGFFK